MALRRDFPAYRFATFGYGGGNAAAAGPVIYPDDAGLRRSGLRAGLTPDGDCRDLTLTARNGPLTLGGVTYPGFDLRPLRSVQLQALTGSDPAQASAWTPLWFGEVRVGGNPHDVTGEEQTWRGMSTHLKEVVCPAGNYASGDVGDVVWAVMQATSNAGLAIAGDGIILDRALVPQLGVTMTAPANQPFILATLLDQIVSDGLSKAGKRWVYGVRPDRRFFFHEARSDTLTLTLDDLRSVQMKAPVAEAVCNIVLWYAGHDSKGNALTHQTFNGPSIVKHGARAIIQTLPSGANPVTLVGGAATYSGSARSQTASQQMDVNLVNGGTVDSALDQTRMQDGSLFTSVNVNNRSSPPSITYTLTGPGYEVAVDGLCNASASLFPVTLTVTAPDGTKLHTESYSHDNLHFTGGWTGAMPTGSRVTLAAAAPCPDGDTWLAAFNFVVRGLDTALMDSQAGFFFKDPAAAPAEVELGGWLLPDDLAGTAAFPLQDGTPYSEPVASYEYRVNTDGGLLVGVLPGQPTDPAILARNDLIRRVAADAAVRAVAGMSG